jgi:hypothetical protein
MRRTTGILVTGTLLAGALALTAAPADAAARKCTTGTWIDTGHKESLLGPTTKVVSTGGAGTRMTIPAKGKVTFDFRKAKKITARGPYKSEPLARNDQYRGVLRITGVLKGKRLSFRWKTKTGNATVTHTFIAPHPGKATYKLTQLDGPGEYFSTSTFTCTKKTLRLRFDYVTITNFRAVGDLRFRRA